MAKINKELSGCVFLEELDWMWSRALRGKQNDPHHMMLTLFPPASPSVSHCGSCCLSCPRDVRGRQWFLEEEKNRSEHQRFHFCMTTTQNTKQLMNFTLCCDTSCNAEWEWRGLDIRTENCLQRLRLPVHRHERWGWGKWAVQKHSLVFQIVLLLPQTILGLIIPHCSSNKSSKPSAGFSGCDWAFTVHCLYCGSGYIGREWGQNPAMRAAPIWCSQCVSDF